MAADGNEGSGGPGGERHPRPEELIESWGRRVGRFVAVAAARVREEAEDIYAEAQSIKRGEHD